MGIISKFKEFRDDRSKKSAERYGDTLKTVVTTKEQRLEAIEALSDGPAVLVLPQLLKRFEIIVDHGIQDNREKEMVFELILKFKEESKPFLRAALASQKRIAWPIKIAEKLFDRDEYLELLLQNLSTEFVGFDDSVQERNIELLLALKELHDPRIAEKASALLKSRDVQVRIAALECLEAQAAEDTQARGVISTLLSEPITDENSRFLGLVKAIVARHQWA